ncbi:MAG: GNAT family N-acetyltransferase [Lachnospira sp.]|nr:GNAT family N-acetyltransferase [Lachnospira sp.]
MNIIEYFETENKEIWLEQLKECQWGAAKFLVKLIEENNFYGTLGDGAKLYLMENEGELVAFCTLAPKDCIDDENLIPWIGFVYVMKEYRGNRYSEEIMQHACDVAKLQGREKVYIATDHVGLYEKYGFVYMENRVDVWGDDCRILYKEL